MRHHSEECPLLILQWVRHFEVSDAAKCEQVIVVYCASIVSKTTFCQHPMIFTGWSCKCVGGSVKRMFSRFTLFWGLYFTLSLYVFTLDIALCTLQFFTVCSLQFTLYTLCFAVYTFNFTLCSLQFTLYALHTGFCSLHLGLAAPPPPSSS